MKIIHKNRAFTLVELLVAIAIIATIITLATVAYNNSIAQSRDHQRVSDIARIQTALEEYHRDEGSYPATITLGQPLVGSTSSTTYINIIPTAPTTIDGDCSSSSNSFYYTASTDNASYTIGFCLGNNTGSLTTGHNCATPNGIINSDCSPFVCGDSSVAYNGYNYPTVNINGQCWFQENLRTTEYNDGTEIPNLTDNTDWQNDATGAYAWNNNDYATYGSVYGALYNFHAIVTENLCPVGWHVPTDLEWTTTENYLSTNVGTKLKVAAPSWDGDNSSEFTALAAGSRDTDGTFHSPGTYTDLWSSTNYWHRDLSTGDTNVTRASSLPTIGLSVRCLQGVAPSL